MDGDLIYKSSWLKAEDVKEETELTIKDVRKEDFKTEDKLVVYFDEIDKGLVLNKTNYGKIKEAFGKETNEWIQKKVALYTALTVYQNKEVNSIRVRPKQS